MDIKLLEDLVALAEQNSFSLAATKRNISQSAFSRRIQTVEQWLGFEIADRSKQPISIHPAVKAHLTDIRRLVNQTEDVRYRIRHHYRNNERIVIATQHALALSHLPRLIQDVTSAVGTSEGMEVASRYRVRTFNRQEAITQYLMGQVDVLLILAMPDEPMEMLSQFPQKILDTDRLVAVVSSDLKSRMNDLPVLGYPEESYFYKVLQQYISRDLFSRIQDKTIYESAITENLRLMCVLNRGVAYLPKALIYEDLDMGRLSDISKKFGSAPLSVRLYTKNRNTLDSLLENWKGGLNAHGD